MPNGAREGFTTRGGSSGDVNGSLVPDPKNSSIFLSNPTLNLTARPSDPIEFKLTSAGNFEYCRHAPGYKDSGRIKCTQR